MCIERTEDQIRFEIAEMNTIVDDFVREHKDDEDYDLQLIKLQYKLLKEKEYVLDYLIEEDNEPVCETFDEKFKCYWRGLDYDDMICELKNSGNKYLEKLERKNVLEIEAERKKLIDRQIRLKRMEETNKDLKMTLLELQLGFYDDALKLKKNNLVSIDHVKQFINPVWQESFWAMESILYEDGFLKDGKWEKLKMAGWFFRYIDHYDFFKPGLKQKEKREFIEKRYGIEEGKLKSNIVTKPNNVSFDLVEAEFVSLKHLVR